MMDHLIISKLYCQLDQMSLDWVSVNDRNSKRSNFAYKKLGAAC